MHLSYKIRPTFWTNVSPSSLAAQCPIKNLLYNILEMMRGRGNPLLNLSPILSAGRPFMDSPLAPYLLYPI